MVEAPKNEGPVPLLVPTRKPEKKEVAERSEDLLREDQIEAVYRVVDGVIGVVERNPILRLIRRPGQKDVEMDLTKPVYTGDPKVPEVSYRNLLKSAMVHRWMDYQKKEHQPRQEDSLDVAATYDLLTRWIERRSKATLIERGATLTSQEDRDLFNACHSTLQIFLVRKKAEQNFYPEVNRMEEMIPTGDPKCPQIPLWRLVETTLLTKAKWRSEEGKVYYLKDEEIHKCYEKCKNFIFWLEEAKFITQPST